MVGLRNLVRRAREARPQCKAGLTTVRLPVQRLVVLLPGGLQPGESLLPLETQGEEGGDSVVGAPLRVQQGSEQEEILDLAG